VYFLDLDAFPFSRFFLHLVVLEESGHFHESRGPGKLLFGRLLLLQNQPILKAELIVLFASVFGFLITGCDGLFRY